VLCAAIEWKQGQKQIRDAVAFLQQRLARYDEGIEADIAVFQDPGGYRFGVSDDGRARQTLLAGDIDAWVSGGGLRDGADKFRAMTNTGDLVSNPSVFFAGRDFTEHNPEVIGIAARALDETDRWIAAHPVEAATILERVAGGPLNAGEWEAHIAKRPWGLKAVDEKFIADQQRAADLFYRFGLLPRQIDIRDAALARPVTFTRAA
jgi:sulfonate transport system substrate-binding protein